MTHQPLVNAIVDVIFNEDEIRTTAYTPSNPLNDDQDGFRIFLLPNESKVPMKINPNREKTAVAN